MTTPTPLHSTKLPLRVWLTGLWLILQSDKGISSVRLAEAVGVSQPTAWRMGHALRLLVTHEHSLDGTVEMYEFYIGGGHARAPIIRAWGADAKASPEPRRRRFWPWCSDRRMRKQARRPAKPGLVSSTISPKEAAAC